MESTISIDLERKGNIECAHWCDEEFRLAEEIGNYVLENPLRRMYKAREIFIASPMHRDYYDIKCRASSNS